jgi:hypothetical protein
LTVFICHGGLTAGDIGESIRDFYAGEPTALVLWDLKEADISTLSAEEIRALAQLAVGLNQRRVVERTAIIAPADITYGLSRMYQSNVELCEAPAPTMIFKNAPEARAWLGIDIIEPGQYPAPA